MKNILQSAAFILALTLLGFGCQKPNAPVPVQAPTPVPKMATYENTKYHYAFDYETGSQLFSSFDQQANVVPVTTTSDDVNLTNYKTQIPEGIEIGYFGISAVKTPDAKAWLTQQVKGWDTETVVEKTTYAGKTAFSAKGLGDLGSPVVMTVVQISKTQTLVIKELFDTPWIKSANASFRFTN